MSCARPALVVDSFGLPDTFPPELMPEAAKQLVRDAKKGMSKSALLQLARTRGLRPTWTPLPHMNDANVFGFGLTCDGLVVPLMVKMTPLVKPAPPDCSGSEPLQQSLF